MFDKSEIIKFYNNRTVFITGCTGFLGKVLLEKILRVCNVKRVYLLIRCKNDVSSEQRFNNLLNAKCFDFVRKHKPNITQIVTIINGDCHEPLLGLNEADQHTLIAEVDIVLHCAATVRFNIDIRTASYINVRATRDLIRLAKLMKNLKSFVHVSTVYSNYPRKIIKECFYRTPMSCAQLMKCLDSFDDNLLRSITHILTHKWPNTYTFTKCVAEDVVRYEGAGLPISVLRPPIIVPSYREPIMGWVDSFTAMSGYFFYIFNGLLRVSLVDNDVAAELLPCDYIANAIIAISWNTYMETCNLFNEKVKAKIFNAVSTPEARVTYGECLDWSLQHLPKYPPNNIYWYPSYSACTNRYVYIILHYILQVIPSYIYDLFLYLIGKQPFMGDYQHRLYTFTKLYEAFSTRNWIMSNRNLRALWDAMNPADRCIFEFSMKNFNWCAYFERFTLGLRVYLMQDSLATIISAKRKYQRFKLVHYTMLAAFWIVLLIIMSFMYYF